MVRCQPQGGEGSSAFCVQSSRFCSSAMTNFTTSDLLEQLFEDWEGPGKLLSQPLAPNFRAPEPAFVLGHSCPKHDTSFFVLGVKASSLATSHPLSRFAGDCPAKLALTSVRIFFDLSLPFEGLQLFKVRVCQDCAFAGFLILFGTPFLLFLI